MKKYLFLISAALLASCSNELLVEEVNPLDESASFEGISFKVIDDATRGVIQYDSVTKRYKSHFFAEQDTVQIYFKNAVKGGSRYNSDFEQSTTYKATRSSGNPYLAGVDRSSVLTFPTVGESSSFMAVYPTSTRINGSEWDGSQKLQIIPAKSNAHQKVDTKTLGFENRLIYGFRSVKLDTIDANANGVGENIDMSFRSPYTMINLSIEDIENFTSTYGKLDSISLSPVESASPVVFNPSKDKMYYYPTKDSIETNLTTKDSIFLTWDAGFEWKNNTEYPILVMPAIRNSEQTYAINYYFEHITLTWNYKTSNSWSASKWYSINLKIDETFNYTVTNSTPRTLTVIRGKVEDIADSYGNIKWNNTTIDKTDFDNVIILKDVDKLDAKDWAVVAGLTKTAWFRIQNATDTIYAPGISGMTTLVSLNAPRVKSIQKGSIPTNSIVYVSLDSVTEYLDNSKYSSIQQLNLGSYTFPTKGTTENAAPCFFNDDTKLTLEWCDIHSVKYLNSKYGYERTINFNGYEKLNTIKLDSVCTKVADSEFKDCKNLVDVEGVVDIQTAEEAFMNCGKLTKVNVYSTIIPEYAFCNDSSLVDVLKDGKTVVPTVIKSHAFEKTMIDSMDVTKAKVISDYAFYNDTVYCGYNGMKNGSVRLDVENTIGAYAFANTAVKRFYVHSCNAIATNALDSKNIMQIKLWPEFGCTYQMITPSKQPSVELFVQTYDEYNIWNTVISGYKYGSVEQDAEETWE